MIFTAFILTGIISISKLEINLYPEISIPSASIITECESLPAGDIEMMVTAPLENTLSSVKGIKEITSVSKEGISSITLKFGWDTDINHTGSEIREKIDTVYPILPVKSKKPLLFFKDLAGSPLLTLAIFTGWLPALFYPFWRSLYLYALVIYLGLAALRGIKCLNPKLILPVFLGIISTHFIYGIWFIKGLLSRRLAEE